MSTTSPSVTGCPLRIDPAGSDIHGEAAALRRRGPATRVLLPGDVPAWSVTDPGLIRRLLTHSGISKDPARHWPAYGDLPETWPLRMWVDVRNALTAYGSEHRRLRRPLAAAFSTRRVRALVPQIEEITHRLLDDLAAGDTGDVVDLRARFAWPLPLLGVNRVLGVPDALHNGFRDTVGRLFDTAATPEEALATRDRLYELIRELVDRKRAEPADDVTSALVEAQERGELSVQELEDSFVLLIGAGHETTVNLLDQAITSLLADPGQLALARSGEVAWSRVVEETLRHQAPVATIIMRFAADRVVDEPTGVTFEQGDALVINFAAAGRDPGQHGPDADTFDAARAGAHDHLSFGHGNHLCVGAELARIEGRIALEALFTRFPGIQVAVPPDQLRPLPSFISNGHQALPVLLRGARHSR
ncbi:cytochrome P450 family protein [Streptomyces genisteinicus]|uniref:Cytochrome P450 n=1 Tax=Streptomyces genisteinicus TaxID=2768068 RepID=A0A7H0HLT0_9ACTN|nr:cytochrome P450 [Streptomyces genisteinicus]QNP61496.1 cytochrome P450 [Streptomyces genisteinicus]